MASIVDVLNTLITDWRAVFRLVVVSLCLAAMAFALYLGVIRNLPAQTEKLEIKGVGSIVFSRPTKAGGREYLVVVHPQGWQETAILVKEGDDISFEAGGSVNIDLAGLNRSLERRLSLEAKVVRREKRAGRWQQGRTTLDPEDQFTDAEHRAIKPRWQWNDPDGNTATKDLSYEGRRRKSILETANYGALLSAIRETRVMPARSDAFVVGTNNPSHRAPRSGKLYFTINDVWDEKDASFPNKYYIDNIGSFYVRVTVNPGK